MKNYTKLACHLLEVSNIKTADSYPIATIIGKVYGSGLGGGSAFSGLGGAMLTKDEDTAKRRALIGSAASAMGYLPREIYTGVALYRALKRMGLATTPALKGFYNTPRLAAVSALPIIGYGIKKFMGGYTKPQDLKPNVLPLPEDLDLGKLINKQASKWRAFANIGKTFRRVGGNASTLSEGVNLASLKQRTGSVLQSPATDKISQRVAANANAANRKLLDPFRGDDDLLKAEVRKLRKPSTHENLFARYGQDVPEETGRVFRGTVGGDPSAGGAYNGAFHYAAPTRAGASRYGKLPAPFLTPADGSGPLAYRDHLTAIHHYGSAPGQKVWRPWGPEDVMTASAKTRNNIMKGNDLRGFSETTVLKNHNPFLGTELSAGGNDFAQPGFSKFFPAGSAADAAQNYRNQTSTYLQQAVGEKPRIYQGAVSGLNTTPWQTSVNTNPTLTRLQKNKPEVFQAIMNRRAQTMLGPEK